MLAKPIKTLLTSFLFMAVVALNAVADEIPAEGGNISTIIIPPSPSVVETSVSKDLQRIFKQISGKMADIGNSSSTIKGRCIYIGCFPQNFAKPKLDSLDEEGIYLYIGPDAIICTGNTPRGVYYAVQELLYRLGYRCIWPGKYGECFPSGPLKLSGKVSWLHNPSFRLRGGHSVQVEAVPGKPLTHINVIEWTTWAARNMVNRYKASYSTSWDYPAECGKGWKEISGHSVTDIFLPASEFKKHPEYFALHKGKRVAKNTKWGTTAMPCVSNPEVVDRFTNMILEYFRKNPDAKRISIGANDEPSYWCECEKCRAMDVKKVDWNSTNERHTYGKMSERWFKFINQIARRVEKEFPDKIISTYSYGSTREVPVNVKLNKNVMIEYCYVTCRKCSLLDKNCPTNSKVVEDIKKWEKAAPAGVAFYGYLEYRFWCVPLALFESAEDMYQSLYKLGVRYISDEIDTDPYSSPVYLGLWARMIWDVNTSWEKYVHDFCIAAYGNVADDMEKFWLEQQNIYQAVPEKHGSNFIEQYNKENIAASLKMLNDALKKCNSSAVKYRVARTRVAMYTAAYYAYVEKAKQGDRKAWTSVRAYKQAILTEAKKYQFPLNLYLWNALGGISSALEVADAANSNQRYELPVAALEGKKVMDLPTEWKFKLDPRKVGKDQKWFEKTYPLKGMSKIRIDKPWEAQGHDYDGHAWYFTDIVIPGESDNKKVWLLFGAIDDGWEIWINGQHVGTSRGKPADIWDKPAAVDITGKYHPGKANRITILVTDEANLGGIWKAGMVTVGK